LKNGKLQLTFLNSIIIIMLGTEAASNTVFTLSEDDGGNNSSDYSITVQLEVRAAPLHRIRK
jgi:hypothetical protein